MKKLFFTVITVIAAIVLMLASTVISNIQKEKRREETKLALIPAMLPSAYPPIGQCREVLTDGSPMYLYYSAGERVASRTPPLGATCVQRDRSTEPSPSQDISHDTTSYIKASLQKVSSSINKTTPKRIDEVTTLDTTLVENNNELIYVYTINNINHSNSSGQKLIQEIRPYIVKETCSSLIEVSKLGVTLTHRYKGNDGIVIGEIVVEPDQCLVSPQ